MAGKIALLGAAPSSDKLAPFGNPEWEIWACSPSNFVAPRVDAWFELHSIDRKAVPGNEMYLNNLHAHDRVYVAHPDPRLPKAIVFPLAEVYNEFPYQFLDSFLQSQVSYMLAWAIIQKPAQIGLWGIDMAAESEYAYQRPGCHFFFVEAERRGIEVVAAPQSDILQPLPAYGYKEFDPSYWRQKARKIELMREMNECQQIIAAKTQELAVRQGALADIKYTSNTWRMRHDTNRPKT
jgi:hypothetical protein